MQHKICAEEKKGESYMYVVKNNEMNIMGERWNSPLEKRYVV